MIGISARVRVFISAGLLLSLIGVAAFLAPGSSRADWTLSAKYSSHNCGPGDRVDPVTVVFKGTGASIPAVGKALAKHSDLDQPASREQALAVRSAPDGSWSCNPEADGSVANGCDSCDRYHIRLWRLPYIKPNNVKFTVGTPHHEVEAGCGHAVVWGNYDPNHFNPNPNGSGFDQGRAYIYHALHDAAGSPWVDSENWGNTKASQQCNGKWAGSNGKVDYYRISKPGFD
jgi:hypothetical protein